MFSMGQNEMKILLKIKDEALGCTTASMTFELNYLQRKRKHKEICFVSSVI